MEQEPQVFMVENIIPHYYESIKFSEKYTIVLLKASERSTLTNLEDNHNFRIVEASRSEVENLHQGHFFFYNEEVFENANKSPIAKRHIYYNNLLRGRLIKKQLNIESESLPVIISEVHSYHINVGHGNCSILVINESGSIKIWMIDCSEYDYLNHRNYSGNIQTCFSYIQDKFSLKRLVINKFFLTHSHYDHYSGISRLIDHSNITSDTIFFLNSHYSMPSENYNRLLRKILLLRCKIVEPLSSFLTNEIQIWHPEKRTIKTRSRAYLNQDVQVEPNPNNSSSVLYFRLGGKSILFPGDIETERWNTIHHCHPHLKRSNYYMISHHGSLNGHLRDQCPVNMRITNMSKCLLKTSTPVLMGRNGAYNGIYSLQVLRDFPQLIYSEKNPQNHEAKFLQIDWQTNQYTWFL